MFSVFIEMLPFSFIVFYLILSDSLTNISSFLINLFDKKLKKISPKILNKMKLEN